MKIDDAIKMGEKLNREDLAKAEYCRCYLYMKGLISDKTCKKLDRKIRKWKNKNRIIISNAQMASVEMTYNDDAKDDE